MAQDSSGLTPEKQLLNIIENPQAAQQAKTRIKRRSKITFSWGGFRGRLSFFKKRVGRGPDWFKKPVLDIRLVNRMLGVLLVCLGVYMIWSVYGGMQEFGHMPAFEVPQRLAGETDMEAPEQAPTTTPATYLETFRKRDLFNPNAIYEEAVEEVPEEEEDIFAGARATSAIEDKITTLRLVGISWSRDPDVLIENTQSQRTFFLKKGHVFMDGVKILSVFKDYVILSYEGQEAELR